MSKLVKDWFNRRAEDAYTFNDESKRFFNWDKDRSSYSSYFIRNDNSLKEASKMIGSMFRVIGVPKTFRYSNDIQTSKRGYTDAKVQVPLSMLRDENGNYLDRDEKLLDAFYGAAIQNAALATMQTTQEYNKTMLMRDTSKNTTVKDLITSVLNTERIDKKLADRLPGYLKFVQKYKEHRFENYEGPGIEAPKQKRLLDLVVKMLRYPANITEEDMEDFAEPLKAMERILKKHGGIPNDFDSCASMATSLSNIVYKYTDKEEEPPGGGGEDEDGSGEDDGSGTPTPSKAKPEMDKSELNDFAKDMMASLINPEEGSAGGEDFADDFEDFVDDMSETSPTTPKSDFNWEEEGTASEGKIFWKKAEVNSRSKDRYRDAITKIDTTKAAVLQKLFARKSKNYEFSMKSMRSGRLDTNKIAEAVQQVPTIYERFGQVTTSKVCVGVLIDESGSMGGTKIQKAREAAIFINEVFKKMPDVELFIYGHTADTNGRDSVDMTIYREKGLITDSFSLGTVDSHANNRDGDAILATARRMRNQTENQGLLIVLSDGAPSASGYGGREAIADTRKKVTRAQSLGFQVIQIAIEEHVPSKEMFDYFIQMTDIKNLPKDLVNYMSKKVDKLIKEKISL
jgi:nitric oxide reductase activation protein